MPNHLTIFMAITDTIMVTMVIFMDTITERDQLSPNHPIFTIMDTITATTAITDTISDTITERDQLNQSHLMDITMAIMVILIIMVMDMVMVTIIENMDSRLKIKLAR